MISASFNPLHLPFRAGVLHVRAEAWAGTEEDARVITDKANVFLGLFHSAEISVGSPGTDADVKALFDSLQVRQEDKRAVLLATVPRRFCKIGGVPGSDAGDRAGGEAGASRGRRRSGDSGVRDRLGSQFGAGTNAPIMATSQ